MHDETIARVRHSFSGRHYSSSIKTTYCMHCWSNCLVQVPFNSHCLTEWAFLTRILHTYCTSANPIQR